MPKLTIRTNVDVRTKGLPLFDLAQKLTSLVADIFGKPASHVAVDVQDGQFLTFAGTEDPCALCELLSIGGINLESNTRFSAALSEVLAALGVPKTRYYVTFVDADRANIGYNAATFANQPKAE